MSRVPRLGLVVIAAVAFAGRGAAEDAPTVSAAKSFVTSQQTTITKVMHPTAKFQSVDPVVVTHSPSGFVLTYTYWFKGALKEGYYSQMTYTFDANGRFAGVATRASNSYVKPFTAANAGLTVLRELAAKELELKRNGLLKTALDTVNARAALDLFLRAKQPGSTPSTPPSVATWSSDPVKK